MSYEQKVYLLVILFAFCIFNFDCFAETVTSEELVTSARDHDGNGVVYSGEVIGDIMLRGEFAWINLKDETSAIGIWLTKDLAGQIKHTGSYKEKGDWIEIEGVFNRSCLQHGGDLDIHADKIRRITPGAKSKEELNRGKRNFAFILLGALCLVWILRQLKIR